MDSLFINSLKPVQRITGISDLVAWISFMSSSPVILGMERSVMTRSKRWGASLKRLSAPSGVLNAVTW